MFKKILVANRGEIALRIIRACREMDIQTVAIYSEPDSDSAPVRCAEEGVCVGPGDPAQSYRNIPNILSAAEITGAEAIHPGYGFLAENSHFADVCGSAGIKFIGPSPETISLLANKAAAKALAQRAGVPTIPGSEGKVATDKEALEVARKIGYPVIIKAVSGGGGRGMRVVEREEDLPSLFQTAQSEAKTSFGDESVYLEKYFKNPRHIEIQILADERGKRIYFGERDCSVQRRHQKLIEESPSVAVDPALRKALGQAALAVVQEARYVNAGTVEFLLDQGGEFYFMEMNTRIQVEHPVTEMVYAVDLIQQQIKIAAGEPLSLAQRDLKLWGHSIECRINAECPERFTPSTGKISALHFPGGPGVRVDSALDAQMVVTPHYDSLLAKLIVHAPSRDEAIQKMKGALSEFVIEGVKTTLPLHLKIFSDPTFVKGAYSTNYLEQLIASPLPPS